MKRYSDSVDFLYKGENIPATLFTYYYSDNAIERSQTIMFNYKDNTIHISLDGDEAYYFVAPRHCAIIDKFGMEQYKKYDDYLSIVDKIETNYIIVNDKVYNYFCKQMEGSPRMYFINFKMTDGTILDGTNKMTTIQDRGNKRKMHETLQSQVNYYNENNVEPDVSQLNEEVTKQYQETKKLIKEIHESL